ncbi:MAG: hypothetical protein JJU31_03530 [Wenzhouxiangella sp.]|nr:hypothetical protein [Wenzhouxiangella sp.]MCH8477192.1 phenylphosphate carboxylase subunit delta [Wenzhouxiangella sp.]TVR96760.1 MAG: hypothetical protein EA418_04615 [Wenzhouxiangellaceae bacterium]
MSQPWPQAVLAKAKVVRAAVFDVDGVMTDGRLVYASDGTELKAFHSRDGLGLKGLMRNGLAVAVITARRSDIVSRRCQELGIQHCLQGREDKGQALRELAEILGVGTGQMAYMGDDLVDWPAMRLAGFSSTPADASVWLRERVDLVTSVGGGRGAVRELCELLLAAHGHLDSWQGGFV